MKEENIFNLLKIHNELLDVYHNSFEGYILKKEFPNNNADLIRDDIKNKFQLAISNLQAALSKLGHQFEDNEIIGDLTTRNTLKENKNVQ